MGLVAFLALRLGIVGTDGSHSIEFTKLLHGQADTRVVAAVKGGSADMPRSSDRVEKFAAELQANWGVTFVERVADLCPMVDAVLLLSVDGRKHLGEMRELARCGKPVFIDKPMADTVADAREIARLAREAGILVWSTSSLRYADEIQALKRERAQAVVWGPNVVEERFAFDLAYEGIHAVEMLYALMGPGVESVTRVSSGGRDVIVGRWRDGRLGTAHLGTGPFAAATQPGEGKRVSSGYAPLLNEVMGSFRSRRAPVSLDETIEILRFLEAAQKSKRSGGVPVALE